MGNEICILIIAKENDKKIGTMVPWCYWHHSALAAAFVDGQCRALYNLNSGRSHHASDVVFPGLYFHCELETRVGVH